MNLQKNGDFVILLKFKIEVQDINLHLIIINIVCTFKHLMISFLTLTKVHERIGMLIHLLLREKSINRNNQKALKIKRIEKKTNAKAYLLLKHKMDLHLKKLNHIINQRNVNMLELYLLKTKINLKSCNLNLVIWVMEINLISNSGKIKFKEKNQMDKWPNKKRNLKKKENCHLGEKVILTSIRILIK